MKTLSGSNRLTISLFFGMWLMAASCVKPVHDGTETLMLSIGSVASWKGYLETGYFNSGRIALYSSGIFIKGEQLVGGQVVIPVSSIVVTSQLLSAAEKAELLHHLQTDAFFNLAVHPLVFYKISSTEKMSLDAQGNNYLIKGKMNLLGKELPLDIPAKIQISDTVVKVESKFSFDRMKWGMTYASSDNLPPADKIKNDIEVELSLNANRF